MKKYFCSCGKQISYWSSHYGSGLCRSCATKKQVANPENNPNFRNGKRSINKPVCEDCGAIVTYYAKRCKSCGAKELFKSGGSSLPKDVKGPNNPNWLGGIGKDGYPSTFDAKLKDSIRDRDDHICQNCGITEEEHIQIMSLVLDIHHIDYNKQNCENNNLITLCRICNVRANYNREYWKDFYTEKVNKNG